MKLPISVIILTYNEELNLEKCLKSIIDWVDEIIVVDSKSTDKTLEIAKKYKARIFEHKFENQAKQFNWALDNLDIKNDWILRLDADEEILPELWREISEILPRVSNEITGFRIKRRVYFMGRWIKHGGYYPTWILRLFRKNKARSEEREMDEHIIILDGKVEYLKNDFIDNNKKDLSFWIGKHNQFASREVKEAIKLLNQGTVDDKGIGEEVMKRRLAKKKYYSSPIFLRVFLYFIYRYFFLLGFLDGKEGLIFHVLQGFWYRFLIDTKIYEIQKKKVTANGFK